MQIEPPFEENEEESKESEFWNDLYENEYNTINPVVCIGSRISDTDNYIFVNHNARDMLQGFSDMLTEDDEKEDIVVFVPKGKNAESYKDIAKEEIDSLTQNAEELRVVYKEYSGREQFYYLNSNREEAIDGLSRATNPIVIYQANEAVALNGSYIETGTYNGEVIYGCDESTIRNAAKKYAEQLGPHYFMLTNVGEDYTYSHSFLVKLIGFISSLCVLVLLLDIAIIISEVKMEFRLNATLGMKEK
jgi:putative ABC transport system permease protein